MANMSIDEQVALLMQGTEYGDENLRQSMADELRERIKIAEDQNRPLKVYCGFDPRTSDLHLGHTVPMRKLRQFQELGHDVVFLIGNYTSLIGDPSDKDKLRPKLTSEEVEHNSRTYAEQAYKILDPEITRIEHNARWLAGLSFKDLIELASNFTIQQFLTRENFRKRWEKNDPIFLHETFYAIMQGYDAFALEADVQVGGTDQLFNVLTAARKLMPYLGAEPNIGIILGILPGTDGEVKMSKSLGNHIPLLSTPEDMYGKVMSVPDKAMGDYFRLVTSWKPAQIEIIEQHLDEGILHPRDVKMDLAFEIVSIFYSEAEAKNAEENFKRVFQSGNMPEEMDILRITHGLTVLDCMIESGFVRSKSEGRRLIKQNGVRLDGLVISDPNLIVTESGAILQAGKRKFVKLLIN
jgi:tyrosyl-tRNA synthetase